VPHFAEAQRHLMQAEMLLRSKAGPGR
jgi:hypothetical protein